MQSQKVCFSIYVDMQFKIRKINQDEPLGRTKSSHDILMHS